MIVAVVSDSSRLPHSPESDSKSACRSQPAAAFLDLSISGNACCLPRATHQVFSKTHSEFQPKTSSILLDGIFRILRPAGIKVFLVENVVDAGGHIQVFSELMSQRGEVEHLVATERVLQQRQPSSQKLSIDTGNQRLADQGDTQVQLRHRTRGIIQSGVSGRVVIGIHVIETGLALQAARCASDELDIHSGSFGAAGILILKILSTGNGDESNQVVDPVAIHPTGELKVLPQSLFRSCLETLDALGGELRVVVIKGAEVRRDFVNIGSAEGPAVKQLERGFAGRPVDQCRARVRGFTEGGVMVRSE